MSQANPPRGGLRIRTALDEESRGLLGSIEQEKEVAEIAHVTPSRFYTRCRQAVELVTDYGWAFLTTIILNAAFVCLVRKLIALDTHPLQNGFISDNYTILKAFKFFAAVVAYFATCWDAFLVAGAVYILCQHAAPPEMRKKWPIIQRAISTAVISTFFATIVAISITSYIFVNSFQWKAYDHFCDGDWMQVVLSADPEGVSNATFSLVANQEPLFNFSIPAPTVGAAGSMTNFTFTSFGSTSPAVVPAMPYVTYTSAEEQHAKEGSVHVAGQCYDGTCNLAGNITVKPHSLEINLARDDGPSLPMHAVTFGHSGMPRVDIGLHDPMSSGSDPRVMRTSMTKPERCQTMKVCVSKKAENHVLRDDVLVPTGWVLMQLAKYAGQCAESMEDMD